MTTIHFEGKFKGKFETVPHCTRWSMSPKSGQTTQNLTEVTCTRCAKQLDITPAAKPMVVEKNKTGTCPCCFHSQKTKSTTTKKMFNHGYERPGYGYIEGGCNGTAFLPYELSVEGTVYMLEMVSRALPVYEAKLAALKTATELQVEVEVDSKYDSNTYKYKYEYKTITVKATDTYKYPHSEEAFEGLTSYTTVKGAVKTVNFATEQKNQIYKTEQTLKGIRADIEFFTQKIAEWKLVDGF